MHTRLSDRSYKCLHNHCLASQGLNQSALPLLIYFCIVLICPKLLFPFISILLLTVAHTQGRQEEGLSPKHVTNAFLKRIKEDIVQAQPEEVIRLQFAVEFELWHRIPPLLSSAVHTQFLIYFFNETESSMHKASQTILLVLFNAVFTAVFSSLFQTIHPPEFAVSTTRLVCVLFSAMCRMVMCCDPQGLANVMIQSFQLSSCTLCNAPIQNVSETPRVCCTVTY